MDGLDPLAALLIGSMVGSICTLLILLAVDQWRQPTPPINMAQPCSHTYYRYVPETWERLQSAENWLRHRIDETNRNDDIVYGERELTRDEVAQEQHYLLQELELVQREKAQVKDLQGAMRLWRQLERTKHARAVEDSRPRGDDL